MLNYFYKRTGGARSVRTHLRARSVIAWVQLMRVSQRLDRLAASHLRRWGLSVAQLDALAQIAATEGATQQQLADALRVTKSNVCQLTARLEQMGLIGREADGRSNRLRLTPRGRTLLNEALPVHEAWIACQFGALSAGEQEMLVRLLGKVDRACGSVATDRSQMQDHSVRGASADPAPGQEPGRRVLRRQQGQDNGNRHSDVHRKRPAGGG